MNFIHIKGVVLFGLLPFCCFAQPPIFSGTWNIDLRSAEERKLHFECGTATFELTQVGDKVSGNHYMSTPRCGRINEGGEGTVKGYQPGGTTAFTVGTAACIAGGTWGSTSSISIQSWLAGGVILLIAS